MIITVDQPLAATADAVMAALTDAQFYERLGAMPNIGPPQLVFQQRDGDQVQQRVQYHFSGELSQAVRRVLDPDRITWVDESTVDCARRRALFRIVPDHYANRLTCTGDYWIEPTPDGCVQHLRFDLRVHYPVVGPLVERAIASGLRQNVEHEAAILEAWAAEHSSS